MTDSMQARKAGEQRAERSMLRLFCAVSIGRGALVGIVPIGGASAWWVTALCLLPGFLVAGTLALSMRLPHAPTLMEAVRCALGSPGVWLTSWGLAALLLLDGVASMTVLTTLFTQGIGTRGTQLTLAILTGLLLLCSLHREGLPRGIFLLRWGMAAAACGVAACLLSRAHADRLFPWSGEGQNAVAAALKGGMSLSWPVLLFLRSAPGTASGRLRAAWIPALAALASILLLNLTIPHEVIMGDTRLASMLLLPLRYAPNALRVMGYSLMMLALFLSIGASAQLAAQSLCTPVRHEWKGLPYVLVGLLIASQALDPTRLWHVLAQINPWLLLPVLCVAVALLLCALFRRNRK